MASLILNLKLVEVDSRILKPSSEQKERQFSEPLLAPERLFRLIVEKVHILVSLNITPVTVALMSLRLSLLMVHSHCWKW